MAVALRYDRRRSRRNAKQRSEESMKRIAVALACAAWAASVSAQGQLNIVCSVQAPWCEGVANAFLKETGIKVSFTQKSAGEAMAQIAAEKANPKIDLWYTGTG